MLSRVDLNGSTVGEIEHESVGTNCGPQAMAAADGDKRYLMHGCDFDLIMFMLVE